MRKTVCVCSAIVFVVMTIVLFGACDSGSNSSTSTCSGTDCDSGSNSPTCTSSNGERSSGTDAEITACSAVDGTTAIAQYRITFTGNWNARCSGGRIPGGAHFTTLTGTTHNKSYTMWRVGGQATAGVEQLAETGVNGILKTEINEASATGVLVEINNPGTSGSMNVTPTLNKTHPLLSLASMVAPTSDWFVGLSSYCLLDSAGNWKSDVTIPLRIYDAGTEQDDNIFSLRNAMENPHKNISVFLGSAEAGFEESKGAQYIGTIRLQKMDR